MLEFLERLTERDFIHRKKNASGAVRWELLVPLPIREDGLEEFVLIRTYGEEGDEERVPTKLLAERTRILETHWSGRFAEIVRRAPSQVLRYQDKSGRNRTGKVGVSHDLKRNIYIAWWRSGPKDDRKNNSTYYSYSPGSSYYVGDQEDAFIAACCKRDRMVKGYIESRETYAEIYRNYLARTEAQNAGK